MTTDRDTRWVRRVAPAEATGALATTYEQILAHSTRSRVSNLWQAQSLDPAALASTFALYETLMRAPAPLSAAQAELIALVVSATNGCGYCVAHHGPRLARALGDEALARAVAMDYREADLVARDRVLLDYVVALTCEPSERKLEDVERIREYGFDDAALVRATLIAAFYNLVNRIASALGVELEDDVDPWPFGAQR
jgi:uncharacterized peroxidase-related enzyme